MQQAFPDFTSLAARGNVTQTNSIQISTIHLLGISLQISPCEGDFHVSNRLYHFAQNMICGWNKKIHLCPFAIAILHQSSYSLISIPTWLYPSSIWTVINNWYVSGWNNVPLAMATTVISDNKITSILLFLYRFTCF